MRTVTYDENEWALVPKVMTDDMRDAGNVHTLDRSVLNAAWQDLLAAAPDHPATAGDAVYDAIGILTEFADDLCSCHTITPDDWDDEPDAKAEYDRIIRCVAQLQAMRASKGGE